MAVYMEGTLPDTDQLPNPSFAECNYYSKPDRVEELALVEDPSPEAVELYIIFLEKHSF